MEREHGDITFRVHWLSFTVHGSTQDAFTLYDLFFRDKFGDLEDLGHGGRFFKSIMKGLLEIKLYLDFSKKDIECFQIEIPGQACDHIAWEYFHALEIYLQSNFEGKYHYKRLDLAFDNAPFTPQEFQKAIEDREVRTLAKRKTLKFHGSPYEERDNGEISTYTVEFGSDQSERKITVYNRRGPTRLEFQVTNNRAQLVASELFGTGDISKWYEIMIGHLRDYIDVLLPWWEEFVSNNNRAWATISTPKDVSMQKLKEWIDTQVAPALSVLIDTQPPEVINKIINRGRLRRGPRYNLLLGGENE